MSGGDAAVDVQRLTGDEVRGRRDEEQNRTNDVLRLRDAAEGYA